MVDELAQPGGEAVGIDEVDEVAVARPLLELRVRQPSEPLALAVGDRPAENGEVGHDELADL